MTPQGGPGPVARAREWRARSISNQITAAAVSLTLAVAAVIGTTTFLAVRALMARNIRSALEGQARMVEQRLVASLAFVVKDIDDLSRNSFIANGLVDSLGRDTYLLPFLREHHHPPSQRAALVLCDFKGKPIASNDPAAEPVVARVEGVRRALASAKPVAEIVSDGLRTHLFLSHPVIFPPTGQVEGVIVEQLDLAGILTEAASFLALAETARLTVGPQTVEADGHESGSTEASVTVRPALPELLEGIDARLEVGTREAVYAPLQWVGIVYVLTGVVTVLIVIRASRSMAGRLAAPIEGLSRAASEVASGGTPALAPVEDGAAEVRTLTEAIRAMVEKLRAANEELEQRVRERTAELQGRERELARYAETQAVLLREVNHRVKNNLAAIISVLHLEEAHGRGQPLLVEILGEMETRVRSLATVHALLSGAEWQPIPLGDLCQKLLRSSLGGTDGSTLEVRVEGAPVLIESGQAHHLALALNELATNTLKYGRNEGGKPPRVEVVVRNEEPQVVLTYRDRGPGFPAPVLGRAAEALGTGLQLVRGIVETSLAGELQLSNDAGAVATIRFAAHSQPPQGTVS